MRGLSAMASSVHSLKKILRAFFRFVHCATLHFASANAAAVEVQVHIRRATNEMAPDFWPEAISLVQMRGLEPPRPCGH